MGYDIVKSGRQVPMLWRCLFPYFCKDRTNIFLQNVGTCILYHMMSLLEVTYLETLSTAMII